MSTEIETPLVGLHARHGLPLAYRVSDAAELTEQLGVALANLRLDPASQPMRDAVRASLGLDLPLRPNTVTQAGGMTALWLAPDEWLLRADASGETTLAARVEQALTGHWFAVTDQTSGYSVLQVRGPEAANVLNAGCPLDLHPRALTLGQCAQSHFFKADMLLRPLGDRGDAWELIVRRSFADSTARMLMDAMRE
ncbi:sarcosine oxidase subunit gamma family protein [Castellaniella sp. GW247-6E4]|uniref:sarcosine oxidase subunit gamma n=1 Tax=Castellaniella sp. GW247-6E4 TaxID=3140380 RepID=UPI003314688E